MFPVALHYLDSVTQYPRKPLLLTSNSVLTSQFWPQAAAACLWTPPSPSGECQPDTPTLAGEKIFLNQIKIFAYLDLFLGPGLLPVAPGLLVPLPAGAPPLRDSPLPAAAVLATPLPPQSPATLGLQLRPPEVVLLNFQHLSVKIFRVFCKNISTRPRGRPAEDT